MRVVGPRLLIEMPRKSEKIGSVYVPEEFRKREENGMFVATVLQKGTHCYETINSNPSKEHWCKEGDRVIVPRYPGVRLWLEGDDRHIRIINDEDVLAVLDPNELVENV
jgi:co-chaperonin GroES (HSP10)